VGIIIIFAQSNMSTKQRHTNNQAYLQCLVWR